MKKASCRSQDPDSVSDSELAGTYALLGLMDAYALTRGDDQVKPDSHSQLHQFSAYLKKLSISLVT